VSVCKLAYNRLFALSVTVHGSCTLSVPVNNRFVCVHKFNASFLQYDQFETTHLELLNMTNCSCSGVF
jgi:hypothetical protein